MPVQQLVMVSQGRVHGAEVVGPAVARGSSSHCTLARRGRNVKVGNLAPGLWTCHHWPIVLPDLDPPVLWGTNGKLEEGHLSNFFII